MLSNLGSRPGGMSSGVAPSAADDGARKRTWTTKARTGCLTCRKRRVKCDEWTPFCRRCSRAGFPCHYGPLVPRGPTASAYDFVDPSSSAVMQIESHNSHVLKEAEPPDWDYLQVVRYYYSVIASWTSVDGVEVLHPTFVPQLSLYYICLTFSTQLSLIAKANDRALAFGHSQLPAGLWASYAAYTLKVIRLINIHIEDSSPKAASTAILYMDLLMSLDENVETNLWLAHINGCLAYIQHLGGAKALIEWKPVKPPTFYRFFSKTVMHNTTIPAREQIRGYSNYTEAQLKILLSYTFQVERPIPPDIYMVIVKITRLRYQIAIAEATSSASLVSTIDDLFGQLDEADIVAWSEARAEEGYGLTTNQAVGEIFRVATRLYAILALPTASMDLWARTQASPELVTANVTTRDGLRTFDCSKLGNWLRKTYPLLTFTPGVTWPLAVLGVAAADGAAEDRTFVDECIYAIWKNPVCSIGTFHVLQKLREFWSWSGAKTGWEECFYEATPC